MKATNSFFCMAAACMSATASFGEVQFQSGSVTANSAGRVKYYSNGSIATQWTDAGGGPLAAPSSSVYATAYGQTPFYCPPPIFCGAPERSGGTLTGEFMGVAQSSFTGAHANASSFARNDFPHDGGIGSCDGSSNFLVTFVVAEAQAFTFSGIDHAVCAMDYYQAVGYCHLRNVGTNQYILQTQRVQSGNVNYDAPIIGPATRDASNNIVWNFTGVLEPGTYELQISSGSNTNVGFITDHFPLGTGDAYADATLTLTPNKCVSGWSRCATGIDEIPSGSSVLATAIAPNGDVIIGGNFTSVSGVPANKIARWNGTAWSALGDGLTNGYVDSLTVFPNGDVVAGGTFTTAGGNQASKIARWNGATWSALGAGFNNTVQALQVMPNGDLIAGGLFTTSGITTVNRIARWSGGVWSSLLSGMNGNVSDLELLPNGDLIACGSFTVASGALGANHVARWDGTQWSELGTGMNGGVSVLAVLANGDIIAAGTFTSAGGIAASNIARWNGAAWSALSGGPVVNIYAMAVLPGGDLITGGNFATAGGQPARNVARWNGATWSALGAGAGLSNEGSFVKSLSITPGGDVLAGGTFTVAGGLAAANGVARYKPATSFAPIIVAQPSSVTTCISSTALISVTPASGDGPYAYAWRKAGVPISVVLNPSAATATLSLANISASDADSYDCVISNSCGVTTSNPASLTVCVADLLCDQQVDDSDFVIFAAAYDILLCSDPFMPPGCPADFNADGIVDDLDFVIFAAAYDELLCP